jgi:hypothetical protein
MAGKIGVWYAMSARREISKISGQEFQIANKVLHQYTDCIWSEGNILNT